MAGARALLVRGNDPDIVGDGARHLLEQLDAGSVDAIIVHDQDTFARAHGAYLLVTGD
jgi:hypothetical protein